MSLTTSLRKRCWRWLSALKQKREKTCAVSAHIQLSSQLPWSQRTTLSGMVFVVYNLPSSQSKTNFSLSPTLADRVGPTVCQPGFMFALLERWNSTFVGMLNNFLWQLFIHTTQPLVDCGSHSTFRLRPTIKINPESQKSEPLHDT